MKDFPLKKHGIIQFNNPIEIQKKAKFYAQKRIESNSKLHETAPEYDRKHLANDVDELGLIAELIAVQFLESLKIKFDALDIIAPNPIKKSDIDIEEFKIDVKGVNFILDELRVNCKAHFEKDVSHYWFIKPSKNESDELIGIAEYWIISTIPVTYWERKQSFTNFFYKKISDINSMFDNEK